MKQNWKKALALLLVLCLTASLFAACGGDSGNSSSSSGGQSSSSGEDSSVGTTGDANFNPTGFPVCQRRKFAGFQGKQHVPGDGENHQRHH